MDKYVIYFAGGTMTGIFGAGVATAFQRNNFYPRINAIYSSSAGTMTGAYFLAKQIELGSSIYWEDLPNRFISYKDFFMGVWQRFQDRFFKKIPQNNVHDALDIDYLMQIVKNEKILDTQRVINQKIPLYVKLFNFDTHLIEYIDARRPDILEILKASVNAFPYVHKISVIDDKKYIDAAMIDIIGINFIRQRHPGEKIIIVINRPVHKKLRFKLKNIIEGKFMQWMFRDERFFKLYTSAEDQLSKDLDLIKKDPNIFLISPGEESIRSRTTNKRALLKMYNLGIKIGEEVLNKIS